MIKPLSKEDVSLRDSILDWCAKSHSKFVFKAVVLQLLDRKLAWAKRWIKQNSKGNDRRFIQFTPNQVNELLSRAFGAVFEGEATK